MLIRQLLIRWLLISAFIVSVVALPLIGRRLRHTPSPPGTIAELAERLRQSDPTLYVVPLNISSLENGVYLCERPHSREQLSRLLRQSERIDRWQGVVYCERTLPDVELAEDELIPEHYMRIGSLVFFGDVALLRRIHTTITEAVNEPR